jgi:alkylhydroperoxidase/carboxymuconolactone decarboxylase family protein YurZ
MFLGQALMGQEKFGVTVAEELADELEGLVDECADLGASRSEIVEAILTAYFRSDVDRAARVRELIIRRREENL